MVCRLDLLSMSCLYLVRNWGYGWNFGELWRRAFWAWFSGNIFNAAFGSDVRAVNDLSRNLS